MTLIAVALFGATFGAGAASAKAPLCNGSAKLCSKTLDKVVLAGSHNAMSSKSLGWSIPNHEIPMSTQMKRGIRAMLIDIHYGKPATRIVAGQPKAYVHSVGPDDPDRRLYLCHAICDIGATPLVEGLGEITKFLKSHPREVMAFVNEDGVRPSDFAQAVSQSGLQKYVYLGSMTTFPTLSKMIKSGQRAVMMSESSTAPISWYWRAYDGPLQETPYSFATTDLLTAPAQLPISCRANRGIEGSPLFLMNHFITRPPGISRSADAVVVNTKAAIVNRAKACRTVRGKMPTIIAVNNVEVGDVVGAAKTLNALR
ncbi:MAG: hypothetical protein F2813_08005 [Actinobacteria bacterium]|uniref:Unannotated protein n=1 Tax=freshwater metagenome TaxID=449393 RepID=A0A6J6A0C8_9ZZZZ|nr:hypothetical protein [Actinomycetota bacterium]